jgi:hypothetical protein
MSEPIVPGAVKLAAKRGFIRTTAQAYAASLPTALSAATVLAVVSGQVELVPTLITVGVGAVSPFLAGAASYLSIIARGLPEDYVPAAVQQAH